MEQSGKKITKYILIGISVLFIGIMLVLPLCSIIINSLSEGVKFYLEAISTEYVKSALLVTLLATVIAVAVNTFFGITAAWLLTKFSFKGKQVLATLIDIPFSISPVIVGLAFLRKTWMDVSGHPLAESAARNQYQNYVRIAGRCARNDFCYISVCIA